VRILSVRPGNGSARPAGESAPCLISAIPAVKDAEQMSYFESHIVCTSLGSWWCGAWEAEGTCAGTRLLDGHVRLDAGLGAGRGSGAGHAHPPPPVCSSLSPSSCSATAAKRIAIMEIAGEKDQTRSCSSCSRLWLW
jgi:hypothetical protein